MLYSWHCCCCFCCPLFFDTSQIKNFYKCINMKYTIGVAGAAIVTKRTQVNSKNIFFMFIFILFENLRLQKRNSHRRLIVWKCVYNIKRKEEKYFLWHFFYSFELSRSSPFPNESYINIDSRITNTKLIIKTKKKWKRMKIK